MSSVVDYKELGNGKFLVLWEDIDTTPHTFSVMQMTVADVFQLLMDAHQALDEEFSSESTEYSGGYFDKKHGENAND